MTSRTRRASALRVLGRAAVVPAAAFAVHQLRFLLAFGGHAGVVLARQGHAYLHSLVPWIAALLAAALGAFLWRLGRALGGQRSLPRYGLSLLALWLVCSAFLVGIYVHQELLEGWLASGHPAAFAGVFGYGGWWAIPAALCIGLVLATLFHGARWALDEVTRRHTPKAVSAPPVRAHALPNSVLLQPAPPLAAGWSGRGPPF